MKCLFVCLSILLIGSNTYAQNTASEYYLKHSKRQKTVGFILLGTGTALAITGITLSNAAADGGGNAISQAGGSMLAVSGITIDIIGAAFLIGSSKNKKRALKGSLKKETNPFSFNGKIVPQQQLALSLALQL